MSFIGSDRTDRTGSCASSPRSTLLQRMSSNESIGYQPNRVRTRTASPLSERMLDSPRTERYYGSGTNSLCGSFYEGEALRMSRKASISSFDKSPGLPLLTPTMSTRAKHGEGDQNAQVLRAIIVMASEDDEVGRNLLNDIFGDEMNDEGQIIQTMDQMTLVAVPVTPDNVHTKTIPKPVDALILLSDSEHSIPDSYEQFTNKYKHLMFKKIIGSNPTDPAQAWGLKMNIDYITHRDMNDRFTKDLFSTINSGREAIEQVFKSFDKDESGTIEIGELRDVAKELGHEITEEELQIVFDEIDENKDGKISLSEFSNWWQKGRKGMSNLMRKITGLKMKVSNFGQNVQKMLGEETEEGMAELKINITRADEKFEDPGVEMDFTVESGTSDMCAQLASRAGLENPDTFFAFVFKTDKNVEDAKDKLSQILFKATGFITAVNRKADKILTNSIEFKIRTGEDKVYLFVIINPNDPMSQQVSDHIATILKSHLSAASEKQMINLHLACEAGLDEIAQNDDNLFFEPLLEAFQISLTANIWKRYRNIIFNMMQGNRHLQMLSPYLLFSNGKINASLESLDIYPEKFLKTIRRRLNDRFMVPKGNQLKQVPVSHIVDKLPLIETANRIFTQYFTASEFKVCGVVHGLSFHSEFRLPNFSKISPLHETSN